MKKCLKNKQKYLKQEEKKTIEVHGEKQLEALSLKYKEELSESVISNIGSRKKIIGKIKQ